MSLLLDTHVLLWWMADDARLSTQARAALGDRGTTLMWSTASTWELAIKRSLGKLALPVSLGNYLDTRLAQQGIEVLPVAQVHAVALDALPMHHRDPFDRMLVAQAQTEGLTLLTGDPAFRAYDVAVLW